MGRDRRPASHHRHRSAICPPAARPPQAPERRDRSARIVSDAELTEELRLAKLLVAPSLGRESFGMVLTRAFACATPVVASDIAGYQEVVTAACGVLVPP